MKKYVFIPFSLVFPLSLGCMCMMPMVHRGHEHEPQGQVTSAPCQCDCVEKGGECRWFNIVI